MLREQKGTGIGCGKRTEFVAIARTLQTVCDYPCTWQQVKKSTTVARRRTANGTSSFTPVGLTRTLSL